MINASIILSRADSKRLPGKALLKIGNKSLLEHCINRTTTETNYETILATSSRSMDDEIIEIAEKHNIKYYRGDANNINQRIIGCINEFNIDNFARVNGDSPFTCADLLEKGFDLISETNFVTNLIPRAFPYGISVEIFNSNFYKHSYESHKKVFHSEHISEYFYNNLNKFKYKKIRYPDGNDHDLRLTVDTIEDLERIRSISTKYENLFELSLDELVTIFRRHK